MENENNQHLSTTFNNVVWLVGTVLLFKDYLQAFFLYSLLAETAKTSLIGGSSRCFHIRQSSFGRKNQAGEKEPNLMDEKER